MFPNQSDQPNQPNPYNQQVYASVGGNQPPSKKVIIIGGTLIFMVLLIVGMLLFGSGKPNGAAWQNLVNDEGQIPAIINSYQANISSLDLQNAAASAQITWTSNNLTLNAIYGSNFGKSAKTPITTLGQTTKQTLDSAQTAGNLDSAFATAIVSQTNLVNKDTQVLLGTNLSVKTKAQLQTTQQLAQNTSKQLQAFVSTAGN